MQQALSKRYNSIAFLGALSLFLATIEFLLPRPVPFFRLGLANLPFLIALPYLKPRELFLLTLLKVLGQGLVNGTLASYVFLFSLSGSFASAAIMILLFKGFKKGISLPAVSFAGAFVSNSVQLAFSVLFIFGSSSFIFVIPLLLIGSASGLILGITAVLVQRHSRWFTQIKGDLEGIEEAPPDTGTSIAATPATMQSTDAMESGRGRKDRLARIMPPEFRFIWGVLFLVPLFFMAGIYAKAVLLLIAAVLAHFSGKKISISYFLFFTLSITFFHLLMPTGKELFSIANFPITRDALLKGLDRGLTLSTAVFTSLFAVSKQLNLPGLIGNLMSRMFLFVEGFAEVRSHLKKGPKKQGIGRILTSIDNSLVEHYHLQPEKEHKKTAITFSGGLIAVCTWAAAFTVSLLQFNFL